MKIRATTLSVLSLIVLGAPAAAGATTNVIVQGTTDVRDAGLLADVIIPGFAKAYPQYNLQYIAVGTGQAITNAEAGQGDAVLTHAPTTEAGFVNGGYSYEPTGRAIFYSDYVILGPSNDPAGVLGGAPNDAAAAYKLIATAGGLGRANFVSRGDASGTNVKEKQIWGLTGIPLNSSGEPGTPGTTTNPPWYHKANAGQAATVTVADQCPFAGGGCYEMTDRGTFNHLVTGGAIHALRIVAQKNSVNANGGQYLLVNSFHAYAVNPGKVSGVNLPGALAFLSYLTSPALQNRLASYPNTQNPAFFADAQPAFHLLSARLPSKIKANQRFPLDGTLTPLLPGAPPLGGVPALFEQPAGRGGPVLIGRALIVDNGFGGFARPTRNGEVDVVFPGFQDLSLGAYKVASVRVEPVVNITAVRVKGSKVRVLGNASPSANRVHAQLVIMVKREGQRRFHVVKTTRAGNSAGFNITLHLGTGSWSLQVTYKDRGAVDSGTSRTVSVSVP